MAKGFKSEGYYDCKALDFLTILLGYTFITFRTQNHKEKVEIKQNLFCICIDNIFIILINRIKEVTIILHTHIYSHLFRIRIIVYLSFVLAPVYKKMVFLKNYLHI